MISILENNIPFSENGSLYYYYEQGHKRFVLNTIIKSQKKDDSMFDSEEKKFVKFELKRLARILSNDEKIGHLGFTASLTGIMIVLMFSIQIALLIMSDDFLKVPIVDDYFILMTVVNLSLGTTIILICCFLFYKHGLEVLMHKEKKVTIFLESLEREKRFGLSWKLGEKAMWIMISRPDLHFVNGLPDNADSDVVDVDISDRSDGEDVDQYNPIKHFEGILKAGVKVGQTDDSTAGDMVEGKKSEHEKGEQDKNVSIEESH